MDISFTDFLMKQGAISSEDLNKAKQESASRGIDLQDILIERGLPEQEILKAKGSSFGIPIRVIEKKVPFDILRLVSEESARHYKFVPLRLEDNVLEIGMLNPEDITAREALSFIAVKLGKPFKIFLISQTDFNTIIDEYKSFKGEVEEALGDLETVLAGAEKIVPENIKKEVSYVEETPITKMVAVMLRHAVEGRASDIHIEPQRNQLRVRFRVDGVLYTSLILPLKVHDAVISRIKILTDMHLDEKRKPQDGRFSAKIENREIDFRVSTFPAHFGEKIVIRILDTTKGVKTFEELGIFGRNLKTIQDGLSRPYGLILLTGPTGSGKSTTLYAMLQTLNKEKFNVVSLEDPVEYNIEGLNQSQVRPEIGYDFANGLRSILRQDPDIIMVGEIRDRDTAKLAIHAALTGHLVLSTLHTNSAIGVIPRLIDMGVDPYLIAPTLVLAIGQRLVQTLCEESRKELVIDAQLKSTLEEDMANMPEIVKKEIKMPEKIYQPLPSSKCPKGTRGRIGVFEILKMTKELESIILTEPTEVNILKEARKQGMINMREDGIIKVLQGKIGLDELTEVG